jgi:hypothetical protein
MTSLTTGRFCLRCFHRAAIPISYGMPCRPPDREVRFANPRGRAWVYEGPDGSWVSGGCRCWPFPPGVRAWVRAMWERHASGWCPPSYAYACLRCGRRFGVFREAERDRQAAW